MTGALDTSSGVSMSDPASLGLGACWKPLLQGPVRILSWASGAWCLGRAERLPSPCSLFLCISRSLSP